MSDGLTALLAPRSVAIIGASDDPTRIGGRPLAYMRAGPFTGALWPVNPNRETVQGLPACADVRAIPEVPDLAIVAVPGAQVLTALEGCAEAGVRAAVVFSSGFAETGADGQARQQALATLVRDSGMRVLGPNCLGAYNAAVGLYATFSTTLELMTPQPGPVAIVSQSGAFGAHLAMTARQRGIHAGLWITTGNEVDVGVAECIGWMAGRDEIRVIAAYAEGVSDGDALLDACDRARAAGKRLVLAKVGRSAAGAEAARSHTAALAGSDRVFDAVARQHGIFRAADVEEMLDVAYLASFDALPASRRIGLMTVSGGAGVLMADAAEQLALDAAPMPQAAQQALKAVLPFCAPRNPVDITAQVINQPELIGEFLDSMLAHGGYSTVVSFLTYVAAVQSMVEPIREAMARARGTVGDRLLLLCMLGPESIVRRFEADGIAVFEDPVRAVRAVAGAVRIAEGLRRLPRRLAGGADGPRHPGTRLDEVEAGELLAGWGVPQVTRRVARDADEAAAAAVAIGLPVAVKLLSPDVPHKTEAGGVVLGVTSAAQAGEAHRRILASARNAVPAAELRGTVLSPMQAGGVEVILGVQDDATFGPVVMVGLGGVFTEVLGDVAFRRAPVDEAEASDMIAELRGAALLHGVRGGPALDVPALAAALAGLSRFAAAHRGLVASVDVNPLRVLPAGEGVLALDAVIELHPADAAAC